MESHGAAGAPVSITGLDHISFISDDGTLRVLGASAELSAACSRLTNDFDDVSAEVLTASANLVHQILLATGHHLQLAPPSPMPKLPPFPPPSPALLEEA